MYLSIERGGGGRKGKDGENINLCVCVHWSTCSLKGWAGETWETFVTELGGKRKKEEKEERNHSHKTAIQAPSAA